MFGKSDQFWCSAHPHTCDKLQMKLVIKYKSFNLRQVEKKEKKILLKWESGSDLTT